jgi:PAS domain S-box-containing protein
MTVRLRTRRADGDWRVLEATGANHLDDPVVRGIVVNSRDITDRIEAVQRLQRQEARYRHIVESTLDSLVLSDLDGTILEANDVAHELYGYEHGDFVGRNLVELVDPEWGDSVGEIMSGLQSGTVATFTGICRRKDGERIWIEGRASLVQEDGKTFVLSMARSITERVRSFELLEQRVQERTRELATLLDVARTISSTLDLETLMSLVLDAMQRLVGYDGASLSVIDGDDLVIVAGRQGFDVARPASRRVSLDERSDIWYLVARGGPVLIDDVLGDSPLALAYREAAAKFQWEANFRAWLGVPVMLKGEAVGVLSMVHREASLFTQHHVDLVDGVTQQLAVDI